MIETVKSVSDFGVSIVIAGVFIWVFLQDRKNYRSDQSKYFEKANLINEKLTRVAEQTSKRLDVQEKNLCEHRNYSKESFYKIMDGQKDIISKLDKVINVTDELVTKTMLEDLKEELIKSKE